jgi:diguanylate cyclase (GGDEF)-like protein/PAS domain S-box-containing protein
VRDLIEFFLGSEAMQPHGYCFLWQPTLLWLSVIANLLIAVAYFSIPVALLYFSYRRKDFHFRNLALFFSLFICACGLSHLISVFTIWTPIYGLQAVVEAITALVSSTVAIALWVMMPEALKLPSTQSLLSANQELAEEIKQHEATKVELLHLNASLDELVALKTRELQISEQRFYSIFEKAPLGIAVINSLTSNFMDVNPTCEQIIGRRKEEILGLNWMEITHPDDVNDIRKTIALSMLNVGNSAAVKITKRYVRPDHTQVWVKMTTVPILSEKTSPYYLQLIEDVTDTYLAEQQAQKQANILEQSLNEIYILNVDSLRFDHANQGAINNIGFNYEELQKLSLWDIAVGFDEVDFSANLERLKNNVQNQFRFESTHRRKNGSQYPVEVCLQIYRNTPDYLVAICLDISQRQAAEQALTDERNLLLNLINHIPDFISYKNLEGKYVFCNERFANSLNRPVSQIMGQTDANVMDFDRLQRIAKRDQAVLDQDQPLVFEDQIILPNAQTIETEIVKAPFKNAEGKTLGLLSVVRDITERKAQEEKITRLSHLYSCLSKASHAYIQVNNIHDLFTIVCNVTAKLPNVELVWVARPDKTLFMTPVVSAGHMQEVLKYQRIAIDALTPENQNPLARCYHHNRMIIDNSDYFRAFGMEKGAFCSVPIWENGKKYAVLTVLSADPNYFDDAAMILMAELGLDLSFALDSYVNIAAKKIADEKLRVSAQVFNQTLEGIIITDANNNILSVNPAFTQLTGYEEHEVLGKNPSILSSGQNNDSFYKKLWSELLENDFWQGEIWNRRKNGDLFAEWMSISLIRDCQGNISNYIALFSDITTHVNTQKHIEFLAHYDALTKLPNRALLQSRLEYELLTSSRNKQSFALLFIDLDHFKSINDALGHAMGDLVLIEVAKRLLSTVREEDTVARLGGDEFNILLPHCNANGAAIVANKIISFLAEPLLIESYKLHVSPSIGISLFPDNGQTYDILARSADTAMYQAKHGGRNQFQFYTPLMQEQTQKRLILENDLRTALVNQELLVYFQPQVDTRSGHIIGAEALLRWNHPTLGNIPPSEFITIAEDCGLMGNISNWILEQAIAQTCAWHKSGFLLTVSVILSHTQISDAHIVEKVQDLLTTYSLPANYLELEITEGVAMKDIQKTLDVTRQLAGLGLKLSIIDFGMGYSTFNYLQDLSLYKLKIDRFFIKGIAENIDKENLVDAIIHMARSLNLKIIARGIETEQQLAVFKDKSCDEFQGFYFSKPIPADEFLTLIQQQPHIDSE